MIVSFTTKMMSMPMEPTDESIKGLSEALERTRETAASLASHEKLDTEVKTLRSHVSEFGSLPDQFKRQLAAIKLAFEETIGRYQSSLQRSEAQMQRIESTLSQVAKLLAQVDNNIQHNEFSALKAALEGMLVQHQSHVLQALGQTGQQQTTASAQIVKEVDRIRSIGSLIPAFSEQIKSLNSRIERIEQVLSVLSQRLERKTATEEAAGSPPVESLAPVSRRDYRG